MHGTIPVLLFKVCPPPCDYLSEFFDIPLSHLIILLHCLGLENHSLPLVKEKASLTWADILFLRSKGRSKQAPH